MPPTPPSYPWRRVIGVCVGVIVAFDFVLGMLRVPESQRPLPLLARFLRWVLIDNWSASGSVLAGLFAQLGTALSAFARITGPAASATTTELGIVLWTPFKAVHEVTLAFIVDLRIGASEDVEKTAGAFYVMGAILFLTWLFVRRMTRRGLKSLEEQQLRQTTPVGGK